jgi:uncharacterized membrane protein YfcA
MQLIYFVVALFATTLGALAGLGGGVIIKPVLDALNYHDLGTIGFLSSVTILSMAIVSVIKQCLNGFTITQKLVLLAIGSVIGGTLGNFAFSFATASLPANQVKAIQALTLIIILVFVVFKNKLPSMEIQSRILTFITGLLLGMISAFLGIGGGPINVAVLCMLFSMPVKPAASGSIFIILFAQIGKIVTIARTTGFDAYDSAFLLFMIPAGIIGGFLGAALNKKLTSKTIDTLFQYTLIGLIGLNIYNFAQALL